MYNNINEELTGMLYRWSKSRVSLKNQNEHKPQAPEDRSKHKHSTPVRTRWVKTTRATDATVPMLNVGCLLVLTPDHGI